jgi:hypothetical protein
MELPGAHWGYDPPRFLTIEQVLQREHIYPSL